MAYGGRNEWESDSQVYTPRQVESVLRALNISVEDETENDFVSLCPYHGNTDTPAFSTSKVHGYSICFNPACNIGADDRLSLERLVREQKHLNHFEAKRFIILQKDVGVSFAKQFDSIRIESDVLKEFSSEAIKATHARLRATPQALDYLYGRGFVDDTLDHFHVGFTLAAREPVYRAQDMIVVPAYDHRGRPVGLVGRSLVGKVFKNYGAEDNGTGFHKSKIVWNLNNARRHESIIITESTFDAMRVHQSGYPNVGALLGGSLSKTQGELLQRHFASVVIMTDNEQGDDITYHKRCAKCLRAGNDMCQGHKPGRELGMKIAEALPRMKIKWAAYDDKYIYANNVKDATAMTDDQIRQSLRNAISHFEYIDWIS